MKDPEKQKQMEEQARKKKKVIKALQNKAMWEEADKKWRQENPEEAKLSHTVIGSKGPIKNEDIAADKDGHPTEEYGKEDTWDAESFRKHEEQTEQD